MDAISTVLDSYAIIYCQRARGLAALFVIRRISNFVRKLGFNRLYMAHKPLIIGLTGNIATGKSTILRYLVAKGAHVIDADQLSHQAMQPDGSAYQPIVDTFGVDILNPDGTIDRPALGKIVFANAEALQKLEQLVHPAVFELAQREIAATS